MASVHQKQPLANVAVSVRVVFDFSILILLMLLLVILVFSAGFWAQETRAVNPANAEINIGFIVVISNANYGVDEKKVLQRGFCKIVF